MTVYGTKDLIWKELKLYFGDKLMYEVIPEGSLYKIKWPDGILSADKYNLTRAKQHCIALSLTTLNIISEDLISDGQETASVAPYSDLNGN